METKKHILIVEDSTDLQLLLKQLLMGEGYLLSQASNGQEALDLLRSMAELPSLIFLDIMMPVMDGFTFRQEQQKDSRLKSIPVVAMTADSSPEAKAKKLQVTEFIRKPLDMDHLLDIAARC